MEPDLNPDRASRGFLRRWFRRATPAPRLREAAVIAFASGKGGTGKSFLVTNAALALHAEGLRVAVVDCDFGLGNAHLLFGVNPQYSMQHLLDDRVPVQQVLQRTPFGPNLLAGGSGIASLADLDARHMQALGRALRWVASQHDVVLLDWVLPDMDGSEVLHRLRQCDAALRVVVDQPHGLHEGVNRGGPDKLPPLLLQLF